MSKFIRPFKWDAARPQFNNKNQLIADFIDNLLLFVTCIVYLECLSHGALYICISLCNISLAFTRNL